MVLPDKVGGTGAGVVNCAPAVLKKPETTHKAIAIILVGHNFGRWKAVNMVFNFGGKKRAVCNGM